MNNNTFETKTEVLASRSILLASPYGHFLTWAASEQENNSRALKRIFDQIAAQVNRKNLTFFGVEFAVEVILHTDDTSVFIALGLVYRADADPDCVQETAASVKKMIVEATGVLELVMKEGKGDSAKIAVVAGNPSESVAGSIVYAEKNVVELVSRMRKIMAKMSSRGAKTAFYIDGNELNVEYRETAVPMVQDVTQETELVKIRSVSDETQSCQVEARDKGKMELHFSEEERMALCEALTYRTSVDVTYKMNKYWKNGRQVSVGGVIQSVGPGLQGTFNFPPQISKAKEN